MQIMGIDPGPEQTAIVRLDDGKIVEALKLPNHAALGLLYDVSASMLVAIEMIASYGMPVGREVFETCVWIGRFVEVAEPRVTTLQRITRHEIKMHICKSPRANDATIRQALIDRYGAPGTKKNPGGTYGITGDMWAALAVATTAWDLHA